MTYLPVENELKGTKLSPYSENKTKKNQIQWQK